DHHEQDADDHDEPAKRSHGHWHSSMLISVGPPFRSAITREFRGTCTSLRSSAPACLRYRYCFSSVRDTEDQICHDRLRLISASAPLTQTPARLCSGRPSRCLSACL